MEQPILSISYTQGDNTLSLMTTLSGSHIKHVAAAMVSMLRAMGYADSAIGKYVKEQLDCYNKTNA